jgi:hypothetical protein
LSASLDIIVVAMRDTDPSDGESDDVKESLNLTNDGPYDFTNQEGRRFSSMQRG